MLRIDVSPATSRASPPSGVLPDQLSGVVLRPSIAVGPPVTTVRCRCPRWRWPGSVTRPPRLAGRFPSVATELLALPALRGAWAIRQLAVENPTSRRIRQYRHGFSYARSASMMDETLASRFLGPMEAVTKLQHTSLKERTKLDTTVCQEGMPASLRSRARCPSLCCQSTERDEEREKKTEKRRKKTCKSVTVVSFCGPHFLIFKKYVTILTEMVGVSFEVLLK